MWKGFPYLTDVSKSRLWHLQVEAPRIDSRDQSILWLLLFLLQVTCLLVHLRQLQSAVSKSHQSPEHPFSNPEHQSFYKSEFFGLTLHCFSSQVRLYLINWWLSILEFRIQMLWSSQHYHFKQLKSEGKHSVQGDHLVWMSVFWSCIALHGCAVPSERRSSSTRYLSFKATGRYFVVPSLVFSSLVYPPNQNSPKKVQYLTNTCIDSQL